ncbi:hypothetical protein [Paractinoplanes maris]|uniref:hypothetical protein n=1 Tax=Paractinoplanes maris TaxID=1734446 RepID=UPI0020221EFD|nr:hypothetical protein [Actinoplanes maris]
MTSGCRQASRLTFGLALPVPESPIRQISWPARIQSLVFFALGHEQFGEHAAIAELVTFGAGKAAVDIGVV